MLPEFDYGKMTRGLCAISNENLKRYLVKRRYQLDDPVAVIEMANKLFFDSVMEASTEESIEIVNLCTAWLYILDCNTVLAFYKPAVVMGQLP